MVDKRRINRLKENGNGKGRVLYWMQRDQRVENNWALLYAQQMALENESELIVAFSLVPTFLEATIRQYGFMLKGLQEVEQNLIQKNIPFKMLSGEPQETIPVFVNENEITHLVTDFNPLKIARSWKSNVSKLINISFDEVDSGNVVPLKSASPKLEYAAYTLRPKINKQLDEFLVPIPTLKKMPANKLRFKNDFVECRKSLKINFDVKEVDWIIPGEEAAQNMLKEFLRNRLNSYDENRNDPNKKAVSDLSPYLHFGQISSQQIALEVKNSDVEEEKKAPFLEELIVRRELAENYCYYEKNYDNFEGFHNWAKTTLNEHRNDKREYLYSFEEFESAKTHDDLWNAAQIQMVETGKMHGFMRMYWAKKILEWSKSPEEAQETAIILNDRYELDGRDPNGYTGIAWSIGGVHDRAWTERPVFGKIRFMNYNGCKRKFDVKSYINSNFNLNFL